LHGRRAKKEKLKNVLRESPTVPPPPVIVLNQIPKIVIGLGILSEAAVDAEALEDGGLSKLADDVSLRVRALQEEERILRDQADEACDN
jgi:hypothetical protein